MISRRQFVKAAAWTSLYPFVNSCGSSPSWDAEAYRKKSSSRVAILAARRYDDSLKDRLIAGLRLFQLDLLGKRVVLKPNLVEFDPNGVINTHPAMISGAIDAFRTLGAREVIVAEGPGHRRDNEYLLTASGILSVLQDHGVHYVDLNYDEVRRMTLRSHFTNLKQLYFPVTILRADLLVSMPKLKTHHWAGVTLSLKNMFGIIPGSIYGWPKNILHWSGIDGSILDINSSIPIPRFSIVDGVVAMEGNGPLQGKAKNSGVIIMGDDSVAVDATAARLMKIEPRKIKYLERAGEFLGNVSYEKIQQIGENLESFQQDFKVIEPFHYLKTLSG